MTVHERHCFEADVQLIAETFSGLGDPDHWATILREVAFLLDAKAHPRRWRPEPGSERLRRLEGVSGAEIRLRKPAYRVAR